MIANGSPTVRFAVIHSGALLKWHAATIQKLLERPGAILAERRALSPSGASSPPQMRRKLAVLGYPLRGTLLDESDMNVVLSRQSSDGDVDMCIAFDSRAAASAPASRLGTWTFDVDGAEFAPGLNAFCECRDTVEARLLQIDGNGSVTRLRAGVFGVDPLSLALTVNGLLDELIGWPAAALRDIDLGIEQKVPSAPPSAVHEPSVSMLARAVAGLGLRRANAIVEKRFYTYTWNIGVVGATPEQITRDCALPPVNWCEAGRRRFFADPFGATIDGLPTIYCEEIDPSTSRGVIVRFQLIDGELMPIGRVLDQGYHVSYPYVFEHEGAWFAIPESSQNDEVALYRLENSGREWRKYAVLIAGLPAVDSSVFVHAGKFWLLCGIGDAGPNHNLHLYHADVLTGPWRPHLRNPVKVDIRSARPAGAPFMLDGRLHRPAQDCTRKYGRRLTILRVNAIDERQYEEEIVAVIEPPRGTYHRGLHTLSVLGSSTLVDGLRRDFSLRAAGWRTLRSFRRLLGGNNQRRGEVVAGDVDRYGAPPENEEASASRQDGNGSNGEQTPVVHSLR